MCGWGIFSHSITGNHLSGRQSQQKEPLYGVSHLSLFSLRVNSSWGSTALEWHLGPYNRVMSLIPITSPSQDSDSTGRSALLSSLLPLWINDWLHICLMGLMENNKGIIRLFSYSQDIPGSGFGNFTVQLNLIKMHKLQTHCTNTHSLGILLPKHTWKGWLWSLRVGLEPLCFSLTFSAARDHPLLHYSQESVHSCKNFVSKF
jgi:hypothetical protein